MDVLSWRRLDLTDDALKADVKKDMERNVVTEAKGKEADPFAPEFLSQTAYWLLSRNLLDYKPDIILIERQRWRSSSSSAIQQWTVRVNSLEAMLWAILTALRAESYRQDMSVDSVHGKNYDIVAVDPKRVGAYWLDGDSSATSPAITKTEVVEEDDLDEEIDDSLPQASVAPTKKLSRGKAEKKAKIKILRTWLNKKAPSTSLSVGMGADVGDVIHRPIIDFSFQNQPEDTRTDAEITRQTFLYATDSPLEQVKRAERVGKNTIRTEDVKKVDDLADCLLQAAAYVAWAENRTVLQAHFEMFRTAVEEKVGKKVKAIDAGGLEEKPSHKLKGSHQAQKHQAGVSPEAGTDFETLLAAALDKLPGDRGKKKPLKARKQKAIES